VPQISSQKKDKISEQILLFLFEQSPESKFTSEIAVEIARDEEFVKSILINLKNKGLLVEINKSPKGKTYIKRQRWRLSKHAFEAYSKHQKHISHSKNNNIYNEGDLI